MSTRSLVLRAYADLLRAQRDTFRNDIIARTNALAKVRSEYRQNIGVTDEAKIKDLLQYSAAVSEFLRKNVIQATKKADSHYEMKLSGNVEPKKMYEPIVIKPPRQPKKSE